MKDRDKIAAQLEELSPRYDHYVDQALDYARGYLLPEDAKEFRDRMKTDELFRRVVEPVIESYQASPATEREVRDSWVDLRRRMIAQGITPPALEAIDQIAAPATTYEQRIKERSRNNWGIAGRIAAVIAFLMLVPLSIVTYLEIFHIERVSTAANISSEVRLPDQSLVRLEPASRMRYATNFATRSDRWIDFEGDAEFTVAPSPRPFRVETSMAYITVTGTRFSVRSTDDFTLVTVHEGKVNVRGVDEMGDASGPTRVVEAGQRVRVTSSGILNEPVRPATGTTP
jgi:ferric-dicitrate binding protein FerR (iron transport regulator)